MVKLEHTYKQQTIAISLKLPVRQLFINKHCTDFLRQTIEITTKQNSIGHHKCEFASCQPLEAWNVL